MTRIAQTLLKEGWTLRSAVTVAVLMVAGCQVTRPPAAAAGRSEVRFVEPIAEDSEGKTMTAAEAKEPVDVLQAAQPVQPLALPRYPERARGKQRIPMTVGMRITVGKDGTVTDAAWSPLIISTPGEWAPEFRAAVNAAIAQWRFAPAELRRMVPRQGGPGGYFWHVVRAEKTEYSLDVEFTFTASGEVTAAGLKQ